MEYVIQHQQEMADLAQHFVAAQIPSSEHATVIGLSGDLGSGKTAFTKGVAKALGIKEEILSPTFVLAKYYSLQGEKWQQLVHIDAYRIENKDELAVLRFDELLADPKYLVLIEWPEQLGKRYPEFASTLKFMFIDETTRKVTLPS